MRCGNNYSFWVLLSFLLIPILDSKFLALASLCQEEYCGNIKIPHPFGIREGCYLNEWYKIECRNPTLPFLSKMRMEVVNISLPRDGNIHGTFSNSYRWTFYGTIRVKGPITTVGCSTDGKESESIWNLTGSPFFFGSNSYGRSNSLVAVGRIGKASLTKIEPTNVECELSSTARIKETSPSKIIPFFDKTGCSVNTLPYSNAPLCKKDEAEEERRCDGNGCCHVELPDTVHQEIGVRIESFGHENSTSGGGCSVAFLTDELYTSSNATGAQRFLGNKTATVTLGWVNFTTNYYGGGRTSCICSNVTIYGTNYANCGCNNGYTGNPYLANGCTDIDECKLRKRDGSRFVNCGKSENCVNLPGDYKCVRDKTGAILIGIGAGFGTLVLVGGIWWLIKIIKKRRLNKRKSKFFKRNGGLLLQQQLHTSKGNVDKTRIFTSRELEKATENFSENRILGQGGQGTVYKGMLVDGRTVAVKKSKVVDEDKLEEFINEVVILSQINHRHVVKLIGCCLETQVPMLVYEFIPNGNLFQHIYEESDDYTMIWGIRMRIAVDIAGALSYLHDAASSPIYHRDVKSTNILLDEKYRAKVSDFGTSRSVTVDQTHWTTVISGTVGYMDPEYYGSSQYTDKSDVYSFGVVLVELITGEKPVITLSGSQEIRGLADHFRVAMKENRFSDIMDARIRDECKPEQVMAVANLARRCLNSKGKKRPCMREVFAELERICSSSENSLVKIEEDDGNEEEEGMTMIDIENLQSIGDTAPAASLADSSSSFDVESLFPRSTW